VITNRPLCVVLVIDDLEYGGAQRQIVELANNMDSKRFDVHICTLSDYMPLGSQFRDADQKLHIIVKKNKYDFTVVPRLARLLKRLNADIVHSYLFASDVASRLAGRLAGTKVIIGSERNANYKPGKKQIYAYKLTGKFVDITIANSKAGAEFNSKVYGQPIRKYRVVYNGVDTERFWPRDKMKLRKELGIGDKKQVIGVFASFKPQKNHSMILSAFKRVLESRPNTKLLMVGDQLAGNIQFYGNMNGTAEYQKKVENLIDELNIRQKCIFIGNSDDVERIYPVCDITVLSSLYEGTPNVLLESMACGIPVVATNVCDNSYIVKDGETGFLVELGDIKGMAGYIKTLLENETLRLKMGQEARNWVVDEFSLEKLAMNTEAVYLEALKGRQGG
jgi:glycosyltransferase involved in cell wall biosynthesis